MPVAHQPLAAVIGELVGMAADQGGNLRLDGLRQQRSRAVAQHLGQRIGECSWLGELENISLCHGVSLLRWRSGSFEHPHDTPPYPFMPSPTFVDSSSEAGKGWSDNRIIEALETSPSMVYRVRKQLVEEGFEAVLSRKPRAMPAVARIFDGEKEAKLIALACSKPPKGRARWTLRLLENKVVELGIVDRASDSTIGRALKKTLFSPIAASTGSSRRRPTARS